MIFSLDALRHNTVVFPAILATGLTTFEIGAAILAQASIDRRTVIALDVAGGLLFLAMYPLYRWTLTLTSLTMLTVWWIAISSVAAILVDAVFFDVRVNWKQCVAGIIIICSAAYLALPESQR